MGGGTSCKVAIKKLEENTGERAAEAKEIRFVDRAGTWCYCLLLITPYSEDMRTLDTYHHLSLSQMSQTSVCDTPWSVETGDNLWC